MSSNPVPTSPSSEQLTRLDSVLQLYAGDRWASGLEGLKEAFTKANTNNSATPPMDPIVAALVGSLLYGKEQQQILLVHCLLHKEPDALALHNLLVAREIQQRADGPGNNFVADHYDRIARLPAPLWPSEKVFDVLNEKLLGERETNFSQTAVQESSAEGGTVATRDAEDSLPIPAFPVSNALLFADPTFDCLSGLGTVRGTTWQDAVVLSTPFWLPRTGKLNKPVNLEEGIPPHVAASIRFDPDRELTVSTKGFSQRATLDDETKDTLAIARCLRVLRDASVFSAGLVRVLVQLMPSLTVVRLASAVQLTAGMPALASLEGLRELHMATCRDLADLAPLATLPNLHKLNLGGCFHLKDVSALASLTNLRELSLHGCPPEVDLSAIDKLPALQTRRIHHFAVHDPWEYHKNTLPHLVPVDLISTYADFMRSDDPDENMQGTLMIRKMLSVDVNRPVDEVIEHGCVPLFVEQLLRDEFPQLQFEAAWALTNVINEESGCANCVRDTPGAVLNLIRLLSSPDEDCREQACWAIGNFSGNGDRDLCLDEGALPGVMAVVTAAGQKASTTRNAAWALSNLCRYKPLPKHEQVVPAFPVLVELLNHEDEQLVVDAAWALSYLSDGREKNRIQHVLDTGCLPRLVELLGSNSSVIVTPAIRAVGSIVGGDDRQTQAVIDAGALQAFRPLINHPKRAIRKEVCWTISNITAGTQDQIQAVINANLLPALMEATSAAEVVVRKEATWAIANATSNGSPAQIDDLVQLGVLPCLCDQFYDSSPKIVSVALEALDNILHVVTKEQEKSQQERKPYADEVVSCGGKDRLVALQDHVDNKIKIHATVILEEYFQLSGDSSDGARPTE